jgi:non-specific serine/threonine protein kinase
MASWEKGDWRRTEARMREVAAFWSAVEDRWGLPQCLEVLAWTAGARGRHDRAARLLGAAHQLWETVASSPSQLGFQARSHQECAERARHALGAQAYMAAFRDGTRLGPSRTVAYALEDP